MLQWFSISANAALNTRWSQFITHVNYKIIDLNVMDWANVTKIHTPVPSVKCYFLPGWAYAVQRWFRVWEWWTKGSHCWHEDCCSRLLLHCCSLTKARSSMPLRPKAKSCMLYESSLSIFLFFAINCQSKARRALYFGILLTSPSSNYLRIEWIAWGHMLIPVF